MFLQPETKKIRTGPYSPKNILTLLVFLCSCVVAKSKKYPSPRLITIPEFMPLLFECTNLLQMLESKKFTEDEKLKLKSFHDGTKSRLSQIVSSEPHLQHLKNAMRGCGNRFVPYDAGISTFRTLYQDVLDDIQVHLINEFKFLFRIQIHTQAHYIIM